MTEMMSITNGSILMLLAVAVTAIALGVSITRRHEFSAARQVAERDGNLRSYLGRASNAHHARDFSRNMVILLITGAALVVCLEMYVAWHTFSTVTSGRLESVGPLLGIAAAFLGIVSITVFSHEIRKWQELRNNCPIDFDGIRTERVGVESEKLQTILRRIWQRILPRFINNPEQMQQVRQRIADNVATTIPTFTVPRQWLVGAAGETGNVESDNSHIINYDLNDEARSRQAEHRQCRTKSLLSGVAYVVFVLCYFWGVSNGIQAMLNAEQRHDNQVAYIEAFKAGESSQEMYVHNDTEVPAESSTDVNPFMTTKQDILTNKVSGIAVALLLIVIQIAFGWLLGSHIVEHQHACNDVARSQYWITVADREAHRYDEGVGSVNGDVEEPTAPMRPGLPRRERVQVHNQHSRSSSNGQPAQASEPAVNNGYASRSQLTSVDSELSLRRESEPDSAQARANGVGSNVASSPDEPTELFRLPRRNTDGNNRQLV